MVVFAWSVQRRSFCIRKRTRTQKLKLAIWAINTTITKMFYTTTTYKVPDLDQTAESKNSKQSGLRQICESNCVCLLFVVCFWFYYLCLLQPLFFISILCSYLYFLFLFGLNSLTIPRLLFSRTDARFYYKLIFRDARIKIVKRPKIIRSCWAWRTQNSERC